MTPAMVTGAVRASPRETPSERDRPLSQGRTAMAELDPRERVASFLEVGLGYTAEQAVTEAQQCLGCPAPACVQACPVGADIPGFVRRIAAHEFRGAYDVLTRTTLLPAVCGRVCPQEEQCERACTPPPGRDAIAIGRLERWVGDLAIANRWSPAAPVAPLGIRVAIVGSGPAGLACAADMARAGCEVTVHEGLHAPGGILRYGIPEFRLPRAVVDDAIGTLQRLGVRFTCNTLVGRLVTVEQLLGEQGFRAVFVATGAGRPRFLGVPGEALGDVVSATDVLMRCTLMHAGEFPESDTPLGLGRRVAVVGSGDQAMDALRVSLRLGAERVSCVSRFPRTACPARPEAVRHAEEEGVEFHWLAAPTRILDNGAGHVRAVRCIRMTPGDPDGSGRRPPVEQPGSEFEIEADMVVYAVGADPTTIAGESVATASRPSGSIVTGDRLATSLPGVFAGGGVVSASATVIEAMGAGRAAARSMLRYLGLPGTGATTRRLRIGP